jgi:nitric oxide reductase subunit B
LNGGLFAMVVGSLLPVGLLQTWASVKFGYWYARSPEFLQTPLMQRLRWMRVPGDTVFASGIVTLAIAVAQMSRGGRKAPRNLQTPESSVKQAGDLATMP